MPEPTLRAFVLSLALVPALAIGQGVSLASYGTNWTEKLPPSYVVYAETLDTAVKDAPPFAQRPERPTGWLYWAASWQAMLVCQVADILSTEWALKHNPNASEDNAMPRAVLYPLKLAIPLGLYAADWNDDRAYPEVRAGVNALACLYTLNNINVGRSR